MSKAVLDTSAILAVINQERGAERVADLLADPKAELLIGTVNLSEAHAVMVNRGVPEREAWGFLAGFEAVIVPFDVGLARASGKMIAQTRKLGLSLGDRACLAIGMRERCPVLTADRAWGRLKMGVEIELIRD